MPLSSEQVYDELSGAEVKQILLQRFRDLLDTVPDFQKHLTLPRVRMRLNVHLDIFGRRNPSLDLLNDFTITTREPAERVELAKELEAEDSVNADTGIPVKDTPFDGTGEPPDQVREDNDLPVAVPVRDRTTRATQQVIQPAAPHPSEPGMTPGSLPGGRRYAAFRVLEREGPVIQGFREYIPGHEPVISSNAGRADPQQGIQPDFRKIHKPEGK